MAAAAINPIDSLKAQKAALERTLERIITDKGAGKPSTAWQDRMIALRTNIVALAERASALAPETKEAEEALPLLIRSIEDLRRKSYHCDPVWQEMILNTFYERCSASVGSRGDVDMPLECIAETLGHLTTEHGIEDAGLHESVVKILKNDGLGAGKTHSERLAFRIRSVLAKMGLIGASHASTSAASTAAAGAGAIMLPSSGAGTATSSAIPEDMNPTYFLKSRDLLTRWFGPKAICMPYIISQTSVISRFMGRDPKGPELLKDALRAHAAHSKDTQAKFTQFFDYMVDALTTCPAAENETIFYFAQEACHRGRLDLLFTPFDDQRVFPVFPEESPAAPASPPTAFDLSYLERCYEAGSESAWHLSMQSYIFGHIMSGILWIDLVEAAKYMEVRTPALVDRESKRSRSALLMRKGKKASAHDDDTHKQLLIGSFKTVIARRQMVGLEKLIAKTMDDCQDAMNAHHAFGIALQTKITQIEAEEDPAKKLQKQFELVTEGYADIKCYSKSLIGYLEELQRSLSMSLKTRTYGIYMLLMYLDKGLDWKRVAEEDIFAFLDSYIKEHPLDLKSISDKETKATIINTLLKIRNTENTLHLLKACLDIMKDFDKSLSGKYEKDFATIGALHREKYLSLDRSGNIVMTLPTAPVKILHDGLDSRLRCPPLPVTAAAAGAGERALSAAAGLASEETDLFEEEADAATASATAKAASATRPSTEEALIELSRRLVLANSHSRFVGCPAAKHAFENALHYANALNNLLLIAGRRESMTCSDLANLQQSLGAAAFYSLEQLLTAILLNQLPPGASSTAVKDLLDKLGHRLMSRFLKGNLAAIDGLEDVTGLLRELEGVGNALKDLSYAYPMPNLLKHTHHLITEGDKMAPVEEYRNAVSLGKRALKGFFTLLYSSCLDIEVNTDKALKPFAYMDAVARGPSAASAAGGGAGAAAGGAGASALLSTAAGKGPISPAERTDLSPGSTSLSAVAKEVCSALGKGGEHEKASQRITRLMHHFQRVDSLRRCLQDPGQLPLFPFYAAQARYTLTVLLEELLCAACEKKTGDIDAAAFKHNLAMLASAAGVFTKLNAKQKEHLEESCKKRNEHRYETRFEGHYSVPSRHAGAGAAAAEKDGDMSIMLSSAHKKAVAELDADIVMTKEICLKIIKHIG